MLLGLSRVAMEVMALFLATHSRICFLDITDDNAVVLTSGSLEKVVRLGLCGDTECRVTPDSRSGTSLGCQLSQQPEKRSEPRMTRLRGHQLAPRPPGTSSGVAISVPPPFCT